MKVLGISHSAVAGPYREKWRLLAKRRGWKLTLALPEAWPEGGAMLRADGAPFGSLGHAVLPTRLTGRIGFFSYRGLAALVGSLRPDLIYCEEEPYSLAALQAARAARRCGAAFVFFSWENIRRNFKPPLNWVRGRVQRLSAGAVLGNSEGMALYRSWGFEGPMALVPQYGVDGKIFRPKRMKPGFKAGYVGRLVREKGADLFVRACALAGLPGRIVGRGPDELALKALASALKADVEFVPFVPFEERHAIYEGLSALVLPSRGTAKWKEQFGRVIIEAGACGVPTLGSDSGAIPEVVGKGGMIFKEGDAPALAGLLAKVAQNPRLRRRLGAEARQNALGRFSETRLASRLGEFLEGVLESSRR
jgi:glycosyltransferase involved in cell wall biosynthesis